jgi:hypothetical protein
MPNKYNNPQGSENPNDRPLTPIEQSNRDEDLQYQRERAAENSGATNGLLIGGMFTALLGLGGFAAYYYSNNQSPAVPTTIINNPPSSNPVPPASSVPEKQTKIIERTIEKAAPPQVIQVDRPVPVSSQIIEVPKPVLVPGETKIIEVPKPFSAPMTPGTVQKSDIPKLSSTPAAKSSIVPSTLASKSPESVNPSLPGSPNPNSN